MHAVSSSRRRLQEAAGPAARRPPAGLGALALQARGAARVRAEGGGGQAELRECLELQAGATPTEIRAASGAKGRCGWLPIHQAMIEDKGVGLVRGLLDGGGAEQLRAKDGNGWLPIHRAAAHSKSAEVVALLLDKGGAEQLRAKDGGGELPIHHAARYSSSAEVVALLLERGGAGQRRAKDNYGRTPLAVAELHRHPEAIRALLRSPAA